MSYLSDYFNSSIADDNIGDEVERLRDLAEASYGIDIRGVYCLATGKPIGLFDESEIFACIDEIGSDTDDESMVDDLIVRVIASMRPSPSMNKPNRETIRQMVAVRPLDAFAYLANRLSSNRFLAVNRVEALEPYIQRIAIYRQWQALESAGVDLNPWIHWMLVLDANQNLHDITPPTDENGWFFLRLVDSENHAEMLVKFEKWVHGLMEKYERRDKEIVAQANWARGNSMTRSAATQSWLENPQFMSRAIEAQAALRKAGLPAKPGRKAESPKTQKLNAEVSEFLHLLDGIFAGTAGAPEVVKAAPRVKTGGSFNFNFARKGD